MEKVVLESEDPLSLKEARKVPRLEDCSDGRSDSPVSSTAAPPNSLPATANELDDQSQASRTSAVEVETLDSDEFEFLDRATQLGSLRSELDDVRQSLAQRKTNGHYIPLKLYRSQRSNSISVTDVQSGMWCEVQVEYRYLHPLMMRTPEWSKMEERGKPVQLRTPEMKQGTDIHLAKELEVHERVEVVTKTFEDKWAVTLIDTYSQLATVAAGSLEREISVFGDPFDRGILVKGIIDQVQLTQDSGELTILDYKTRRTNTMPSTAQKQGHSLQLMLYKCMLDNLTCGMTKMNLLAKHLNLNFSRELTAGVLEHIARCGLRGLFNTKPDVTDETSSKTDGTGAVLKVTFGELADKISQLIVGLDLPLVSSLMIQYTYQGTHEEIGMEVVQHDEAWTKKVFENSLDFWLGKREAHGVDLEDLWKCNSCQFKEVCVWRRQKELEQSPAASKPHHIF